MTVGKDIKEDFNQVVTIVIGIGTPCKKALWWVRETRLNSQYQKDRWRFTAKEMDGRQWMEI